MTTVLTQRKADHQVLRESVRSFVTREILPHIDHWERSGMVPLELHAKAAQAGLLGIGFPEDIGGCGGDALDQLIMCEEFFKAGAPLGVWTSLTIHCVAIPHMAAAGNQTHLNRWVRPCLDGQITGSLAVTEPDVGSDVAAIATRAVSDGDHYIVNGAKTFISSGARASFYTTAVRTNDTPGAPGLSLLAIDRSLPGVHVEKTLDKLGWLSSDTVELSFTDVRVPKTDLIGPEGSGFKQIMKQFTLERLMIAGVAYAAAMYAYQLAADWAHQRHTFGTPLTHHQVIRHQLAEMWRQLHVARTYTLTVAEQYIQNTNVTLETALAKNTAVFACNHVVDNALQIFGGMGFMREGIIERYYRDIRVLGIGGGTNQIMNEIIAKAIL